MKNVELLSPAGSFEKLRAAVRFGADAVYLAGKDFGMRAGADCFDNDGLAEAVEYCRARQKRVYLTLNVMPHPAQYPALRAFLRDIGDIPFDAFIIGDLGVLSLVRKLLPRRAVHVSTQASVVSAESANTWYDLGAKRVVLSRELTLDEIAAIRRDTPPELELEAFIHGAMCVSYSGRCLISNHLTGRDANLGACTQPCRWEYEIREKKHENSPLTLDAGCDGTFIFGSKDLCMIEHVPELMESGICSFKIEGRMKSAYYAAVTANAYRMAIDAYVRDPAGYRFDPAWLTELESVSHREYDTGFFFGKPIADPKLASTPGYVTPARYIGDCVGYKDGVAAFTQKNKVCVGETVELLAPGRTGRAFTIERMTDENGAPIDSAPHPDMKFYVDIPFEAAPGDILRG